MALNFAAETSLIFALMVTSVSLVTAWRKTADEGGLRAGAVAAMADGEAALDRSTSRPTARIRVAASRP